MPVIVSNALAIVVSTKKKTLHRLQKETIKSCQEKMPSCRGKSENLAKSTINKNSFLSHASRKIALLRKRLTVLECRCVIIASGLYRGYDLVKRNVKYS